MQSQLLTTTLPGSTSGSSAYSVRDLVAMIFRRRRVMILAFCAVILGFGIARFRARQYTAEMRFLVQQARVDPLISPAATSPSSPVYRAEVSEEQLNSEVELLRGDDLLRQVVVANNLQNGKNAHGDENLRIDRAAKWLRSGLDIEPIKKTDLISVKYHSSDPALAMRVLQSLQDVYLQKHIRVHQEQNQSEFLQQQADQYRQSLEEAEARLNEFAHQAGSAAPQQERDQVLQNLSAFDSNLQQTQAALKENQNRIADLQRQVKTSPERRVTQLHTSDNPTLIQQLRSTLLTLQMKRTELLSKYVPTYRPVQEVEKQIAQTQAALEDAQSRPLREETTDRDPTHQWMEGELAKARAEQFGLSAKASSLRTSITQYQQRAEDLNEKAMHQADLARDAKTQEENYLLYKRKLEEDRISQALDARRIGNVVVAQQPSRPTLPDSSPLDSPLLALIVALAVSAGVGLISEYFDPFVHTPYQVERTLDVPLLAAIPRGPYLTAFDQVALSPDQSTDE
jgi:uncharacterized protein involved in exopolysaccharide biosynthesis